MKISINEKQPLVIIKKEVERIENNGKIRITSQAMLERAIEIRKKILATRKILESKKREIVEPLERALKKTRELFKPYEQRLEIADNWLKEQMLQWEEIQEAEIKRKRRKLREN